MVLTDISSFINRGDLKNNHNQVIRKYKKFEEGGWSETPNTSLTLLEINKKLANILTSKYSD